jgi:hypothetical protein
MDIIHAMNQREADWSGLTPRGLISLDQVQGFPSNATLFQ